MAYRRKVITKYGSLKVVFTTLEKAVFSSNDLLLELKPNGKILLEFVHIEDNEKDPNYRLNSYSVGINVGDYMGFTLYRSSQEFDARSYYVRCLSALSDGGKIAGGIHSLVKVLDYKGNTIQ